MGTMRDAAGQLTTKTTTLNINNSPKSWKKIYAHIRGDVLMPPLLWTHFPTHLGELMGDVRRRPHGGLFSEDKMAVKPQKCQESTWILAFLSLLGHQDPRFLPLMDGKRKGIEMVC